MYKAKHNLSFSESKNHIINAENDAIINLFYKMQCFIHFFHYSIESSFIFSAISKGVISFATITKKRRLSL